MNSPNLPRPRRRTAVAPAALVATTLCLLPLSLPPAPPPGQLLASQCAQCHGTNGQAVSGFESIRGKSASDMFKTLVEMKNRPAETIMDRQARGFTGRSIGSGQTFQLDEGGFGEWNESCHDRHGWSLTGHVIT